MNSLLGLLVVLLCLSSSCIQAAKLTDTSSLVGLPGYIAVYAVKAGQQATAALAIQEQSDLIYAWYNQMDLTNVVLFQDSGKYVFLYIWDGFKARDSGVKNLGTSIWNGGNWTDAFGYSPVFSTYNIIEIQTAVNSSMPQEKGQFMAVSLYNITSTNVGAPLDTEVSNGFNVSSLVNQTGFVEFMGFTFLNSLQFNDFLTIMVYKDQGSYSTALSQMNRAVFTDTLNLYSTYQGIILESDYFYQLRPNTGAKLSGALFSFVAAFLVYYSLF